MEFISFKYDSSEYLYALELRNNILRAPLGLKITEEFLLQDKNDYILAIFEEEKILAVLHLKPVSEKVLKMRQVAVAEHIQGKGIGSKLVKLSENFALEKGFNEIILNARETAVNFYLKMNYKISGKKFIEVGIPHFKMNKKLSDV